jgi:hypothetical protein
VCALTACGDDGGGGDTDDTVGAGSGEDGGPEGGNGGGGRGGSGGPDEPRDSGTGGSGPSDDAGMDGSIPDPFEYDAAGDYTDDGMPDAGPAPDDWSCAAALWQDGHCDCSCGATDVDCAAFSCTEPGCVAATCDACFSASGTWKPCTEAPDPDDWSCAPGDLGDAQCDCGCTIPDPACMGRGCSEPGCRKTACDTRHGCVPGTLNDADDDCSSVNPSTLTGGDWTCAWDHYGSGDGCHCGCGAKDPDCNALGCTAARCFDSACAACSDELGRPYPCAAAEAGWDHDLQDGVGGNQAAECNGLRFGAGDGCDCGCGGLDPDCGDGEGCDEEGCWDDACDRCTDNMSAPFSPTGCATATAPATPIWVVDNQCNPDNYGTGDGCDCGCGVPDPDCDGGGCTAAGCQDATCDVCNDGAGFFVQCPGWVCTDAAAMSTAECDCGCGVIDPACRDFQRQSCTEPGCELAVCEFCNDASHVRAACGGEWTGDTGGTSSACSPAHYGDGLCDCGCGAADPDCAADEGCLDRGCVAPGCDVCHDGNLLAACRAWTCDVGAFGSDDGCDCSCGARDPDCGIGGCEELGCSDAACETCHDPFGRAVPCP